MKTKTKVQKSELTVFPVNKYLLIKRSEPIDLSVGGILIPNVAKKKLNQGTIMDIGIKCEQIWEKGEVVIFNELSSYEIKDADETEYVLVPEDMVYVKYK